MAYAKVLKMARHQETRLTLSAQSLEASDWVFRGGDLGRLFERRRYLEWYGVETPTSNRILCKGKIGAPLMNSTFMLPKTEEFHHCRE